MNSTIVGWVLLKPMKTAKLLSDDNLQPLNFKANDKQISNNSQPTIVNVDDNTSAGGHAGCNGRWLYSFKCYSYKFKFSKTFSFNRYILKDDVVKSKIIWALNKSMTHGSARGQRSSSNLFSIMFPDNLIAKQFQMQKDKLLYVITFGLGPYFQKILINDIIEYELFAISFDESLNKVSQKAQMDLIVRYWNDDSNMVNTRYLTSSFLEWDTANHLKNLIESAITKLNLSVVKIIQIGLEGPNFKLKFLKEI